ncbi:tannase/feruloyl esterase family alpha/beta hydrolase [Pusillimonas sp. CC-YST705]|uniref:Tannase/feruloyl esterase family alpha/beta hydrolase n=1 Tax=Mesopusillimonas faecipullorum TaxID=2755040 RepID=A0ABS8CG64_9BURK|nr:tannase/feruloyl esterase family alpha/beta hydrolase [Mesopusillimonas faecipullorum]MCB5364817.1 tannase/feruloyl esterase family alpha/beta hydrolase [Mesopusillimonas faecipullorum]
MNKRYTITGAVALSALIAGCGGSSGSDSPEPTPTPPAPAPQLSCAEITTEALDLEGLVITKASQNGAEESSPAHCLVEGNLHARKSEVDNQQYAIGFEVRLPEDWNGRFFFQGGGGTDGAINPAMGSLPGEGNTTTALALGYAVASTDGGHKSVDDGTPAGGSLFGLDPQARVDYGYNAVGEVTQVAQNLIERHYDSAAHHSYFVGCSNGGRQGMVAASRFAHLYDGIIAGNPGFNLPQAGIQHAWDNQQFAKVAPIDADSGLPIIQDAFTMQDMGLVANAALQQCDALDGLADGLISNLAACDATFDPDQHLPRCEGAKDASCLSAEQIDALKGVFGGPKNSQGEQLYASWPWDAGVGEMGWRLWKLAMPFPNPTPTIPNSIIATMGGSSLPYVFMTPPSPVSGAGHGLIDYLLSYNFDSDAPGIYRTNNVYTESAMSFMTPPNPSDLSAFRDRGSKMIVYHGNSDPVFSVHDTINWYENLGAADAKAADYARLFTIPGQNHCSGGPSTSQFDMLTALVDWVEEGKAPDQIIAQASAGSSLGDNVQSRPLCPHPQYAQYDGKGDPKVASSFACVAPNTAG